MDKAFPVVYMRGGTSKGLIFHKESLPQDTKEWDAIFLQCMGSPDPKQMDGMGGMVSSNNKVVVVSKSKRQGIDVDYLVGQVVVGRNQVDYQSNCGNMTAAVAPFAVEESLVEYLTEPVTTVRMYNENTNKVIYVDVPVRYGKFDNTGDCRIAGVDGTAGELLVRFMSPTGSKTGKLFPTGRAIDVLNVPGAGPVEATILDVSNPMVVVRACDLRADVTALPSVVNADATLCDRLEALRGQAAVRLGFCDHAEAAAKCSPAIPKIGFFSSPRDFTTLDGQAARREEMDLCVRVISVFKCHQACPLTSAGAISACAKLPGTILQRTLPELASREEIRIGHPSGIMTIRPRVDSNENTPAVAEVDVRRTARRIMQGTIFVRL